jgi:hypothetical protein
VTRGGHQVDDRTTPGLEVLPRLACASAALALRALSLLAAFSSVMSVRTTPEAQVAVSVPPNGITVCEALELSGALVGAAAHLAEAETA